MGWIEIDNLSKCYVRKGKLAFISRVDSDDDDEDDFDRSTADAESESEECERAQKDGDAAREVWALRDINLRINEGEAVAVVGLGGSGKTTLMRILAGLTVPTSGEVRGKGLRVPLSFLRSPILSSATGRQNLAVLESLFGMSKGRILDRANEIAAFAEMEREIDQVVSQYSSSMYGRLALAAGLFCDPGILLVDDRIVGGDAPFRAKAVAKLGELVSQGTTLIYAGHTPKGLPRNIFQRAVWLSNGRIVADGKADVVLPRYEACAFDPDDLPDMQAAIETAGLESIELSGTEEKALSRRDVRLVSQQRWHAKVKTLEARWGYVLERHRASRPLDRRNVRPSFYRAELSSLGKVADIRIVDNDGRRINAILPGEAVQVEIEVEVSTAKTEIGLRLEVDTRDTLLFVSDLPMPFCADEPGRYLFSFPFEAWLTQQEMEAVVLYKIRARTFFRRPSGAWEDMNVAAAGLNVRGSLRERFMLTREAALSEPVPTWLDEAAKKPSTEYLERKPLLRPRLDWQIHFLKDATGDEAPA